MDTQEYLREIYNLRLRFQMNNRLRLECLAALSKIFREHGENLKDELLSSLVFAIPAELPGERPNYFDLSNERKKSGGHPPAGHPPAGHPPGGQPLGGYPPGGQTPEGQPPAGHPPAGYPPGGQPPGEQPPEGQPPGGYPPGGQPPGGQPPGKRPPGRRPPSRPRSK